MSKSKSRKAIASGVFALVLSIVFVPSSQALPIDRAHTNFLMKSDADVLLINHKRKKAREYAQDYWDETKFLLEDLRPSPDLKEAWKNRKLKFKPPTPWGLLLKPRCAGDDCP